MATTPEKKTPPAAPARAPQPPQPVKASPPAPKAEEKKPEPAKAEPAKAAPKAEEKKPEPKAEEKKPEPKKEPEAKKAPAVKDQDALSEVATDRGWQVQEPKGSATWDVVYTKPNPVLGGYEHLRLTFKGDKVDKIEHENLNQPVEVPDKDRLDYAVGVLTGEPVG